MLLAQGVDVIVIDKDVARIQAAAKFGFKIYYGDGTRLDVLRAAGAPNARIVAVCVDDRTAALTIAELVRGHFPLAKIHARAYDRIHAIDLLNAGVDFQLRETVLSALEFGRETLVALGIEPEKAADVLARVRERDEQRRGAAQVWLGVAAHGQDRSAPDARAAVAAALPLPAALGRDARCGGHKPELQNERSQQACLRRPEIGPARVRDWTPPGRVHHRLDHAACGGDVRHGHDRANGDLRRGPAVAALHFLARRHQCHGGRWLRHDGALPVDFDQYRNDDRGLGRRVALHRGTRDGAGAPACGLRLHHRDAACRGRQPCHDGRAQPAAHGARRDGTGT